MPNTEIAVLVRRFQRAKKPFYIYKIDGSFTYVNETCEITYMPEGLNIEGRVKFGHFCPSFADWVYIPYKSILEVVRLA